MNSQKTKYILQTLRPIDNLDHYVNVAEEQIETVEEFVYFGSLVNIQNDVRRQKLKEVFLVLQANATIAKWKRLVVGYSFRFTLIGKHTANYIHAHAFIRYR